MNERTVTDKAAILRKGGWISLLVGGAVGLITVASALLSLFMTDEPLLGYILFVTFGYSIAGLLLSFFLSLWFMGKKAASDLLKGKKLLIVSVKYSGFINAIIWTVFIITGFLKNRYFPGGYVEIFLYLPLVLAGISILITPFTIGLLICYIIRKKCVPRA